MTALPPTPHGCLKTAFFILAASVLLSGGFVRADVIRKAGTGTDLSSGASWGGTAPGYSDVATWTADSLGAGLIFQGGAYWGGVSVTSASSDIDVSGFGYIQLGAAGIDMSAALANMSLAENIILGTNQTWNVNAGQSLSVSGPITGGWNLLKNGAGTLTLSANNPVTGITTVNAGTLAISGQIHYNEGWQSINALTINPGAAVTVSSGDAANFLGECNFDAQFNTIDGGSLKFDTQPGTAESIYRAFTIGGNGATFEVLNPDATLTFEYFSAPMQFSVPAAASLTLAGAGNGVMNKTIGGNGGLVKCGSGTWLLNGANNFWGPTIVSNGTLVVNGSLWYGPVTVAAGATLGGPGAIFGNITFLPGAQAQFTSGAVAAWSGTLTLNDNLVHLALANSMPPGNYVLATYQASGNTGIFHGSPIIDSGSLADGCSARIKTDRGNVALVVLPPPAPHLAVLSVNGGSNATAGLGFSVTVQAQDTDNNPMSMPSDTPVSLSLSSGYGTLGGNLSGVIPAGGSSTIMSGVTYTLDEGNVVITATNNGTLLPGDSAPFAVNLGPATTMTLLSAGPYTSAPGTALPNPFIVTVTDPGGNLVPGAGVTFAIISTPSGATGQSLSITNASIGPDGAASCSLTLGDKLGSYTVTATLNGPTQNPVIIAATAANNKWTQIWSDEFNYSGLPDSNKWNYEVGFVRNGENQYYTSNRIENACVTNGMLAITARKEAYTPPGQSAPVANYTSASLITLGKESWTYGRLEVRAKMPPPIGGVWTAFWTQGTNFPVVGWPICGELDVVEYVNWNPNPHGNAFWGYNGGTVGDGYIDYLPAIYSDFHIYAAEWSSDRINYFYDDTNYYTIYLDEAGQGPSNPFRNPQYLLLNFALGGGWGGLIYDPGLPQQYLIDYVRVYQQMPTWTGLCTNSLWSSPANWINSLPPTSGGPVVFAGGSVLNSVVDSACCQAGVTFYETADSNVICATNGGSLTLTRTGIRNDSTNAQTLNVPIILAADETFTTDPGSLTIGGAISGNGFGLSKTGPGTLTLCGANIYSGSTTIAAGTLALGAGGSGQSSGFKIAAGATLDVSAAGDYTFGNNVLLCAGGEGVMVGTTAACLKGGNDSLISLNSNPINLVYDGANPSLYVSQGVLTLAGNSFAINSATGRALPPGNYPIILQAAGAIVSTGAFPAVAGNAIGLGQTGFITISNNTVNLTIAAAPTLSLNVPVTLGGRTIQLTFPGVNPSLAYRVQVNGDLATTNWTTLFTNDPGTNGSALIIDPGATNCVRRFYRIVTP